MTPLSPEERATAIRAKLKCEGVQHFIPVVAAQIREAVEEAISTEYAKGAIDQQKRCKDHIAEAYAKGWNESRDNKYSNPPIPLNIGVDELEHKMAIAEAYEECAEIARKHKWCDESLCAGVILDEIEELASRAPEIEGKEG